MATVTISTHNGTRISRQHNRRNPKVVSKEKHINKNGIHEAWIDISLEDAYKRLFGKAVEEYNSKQKRKDRRINDYLSEVKKDKKKHESYEMIVGVYGDIPNSEKKAILKDFFNGWNERNSNLALYGAYYHEDEEGQPHLHLDYIPVGTKFNKGMSVQNSLNGALTEQGFKEPYTAFVERPDGQGRNILFTRQIQWERAENDALEQLCEQYGHEVSHPQRGKKVKHEETATYKARKELEELERQKKKAQLELDDLRKKIKTSEVLTDTLQKQKEREEDEKTRREKTLDRLYRHM